MELRDAKHAGYVAGHALSCLATGESLLPIFGYVGADDTLRTEILVLDPERCREVIEERLRDGYEGAHFAVLASSIPFADYEGASEGLSIELFGFQPGALEAIIVLPYRSAESEEGFRPFRPHATLAPHSQHAMSDLINAFLDGLSSHEEGLATLGGNPTSLKPSNNGGVLVARAAAAVFTLVAAADGQIDGKELDGFVEALTKPCLGAPPVVAEAATAAVVEMSPCLQLAITGDVDHQDTFVRACDWLDDNYGDAEAAVVRQWLMELGVAVARKTARGIFSKKIRPDEAIALAVVADLLGVRYPSV